MDGYSTEKRYEVSIRVSIYVIANAKNGKVYVGQTRHPRRRWTDHKYAASHGADTYFCNAIRKYGTDAFTYRVVEECDIANADDREVQWIKKLKANNKQYGYNCSIGGTNGNNSTSEEIRHKISLAKKGVSTGPCSPEKAERIRQAKLSSGYRHSDETRKKISEKRNVTVLTDEWRKSISEGLIRSAKYKLDDEAVHQINHKVNSGQSLLSIAKEYGVSWRTVDRVRKGEYAVKQKGEYQS